MSIEKSLHRNKEQKDIKAQLLKFKKGYYETGNSLANKKYWFNGRELKIMESNKSNGYYRFMSKNIPKEIYKINMTTKQRII